MKVARFLFSVLLLGAMASTASAQSVSLNWNTCTGPIDRTITADNLNNLYASVLGQDTPHKAYQVFVALGSGNAGDLRDAWRFDPAGCQGSSFITINHLAPAAVVKSCPTFQGALPSIQIKDYSYDAVSGKARIVLANTYPDGQFTTVNPALRYFLMNVNFDHTFSVVGPGVPLETCGGMEVPVCLHMTKASWLTMDGVEIQWPFAQEYVTANDANNSTGCPGATPAATTSWGAIKGTYRR